MKVHFIAIGGSAMHNMAIALKKKGYQVSGSDDEIFEPSKTRLKNVGLLPENEGWFPEKISSDIDAVILGMHARKDNPELIKAQELGLKIFSYPEYIYEQSKDKTRVVIGGSHGKTSITSMILHVLKFYKKDFDYMVGAQLEGFDTMFKLTEAPIMVIEGDEYLASPIDRRPKFHLYKGNIGLISGIAWDHINVFPKYEDYVKQFDIFLDTIVPGGSVAYCSEDQEVDRVMKNSKANIEKIPYAIPPHEVNNGKTVVLLNGKRYPLLVFGQHNLMNLNGAGILCEKLGISSDEFWSAVGSFKGAAKRLELVKENENTSIYKDFAHSPSKLKATVSAVRTQFPNRELFACMELHTFSSLTKEFLLEYKGCMNEAHKAIVYFNPHTIEHKKLPPISKEQVKESFGREDLIVITDSKEMQRLLKLENWNQKNLLLMSSGNFDGINFDEFAKALIG